MAEERPEDSSQAGHRTMPMATPATGSFWKSVPICFGAWSAARRPGYIAACPARMTATIRARVAFGNGLVRPLRFLCGLRDRLEAYERDHGHSDAPAEVRPADTQRPGSAKRRYAVDERIVVPDDEEADEEQRDLADNADNGQCDVEVGRLFYANVVQHIRPMASKIVATAWYV